MKIPTLLTCLLLMYQALQAQSKTDESNVQKQFNSVASYSNQMFDQDISFRRTAFNQYVEFDSALFKAKAYFTHTYFNFQSSFKNSQFNQEVFFNSSEFQGFADFSYAKFQDNAHFKSAQFADVVEFQMVDFQEATFRHAQFKSAVNFIGSKFNRHVTFNRAHFMSEVDFSHVKFNTLSFYKTTFEKSPDFSFAEFPETIFLEKINFKGDAILDLNPIHPKDYVIDLRQFPMERIKLRWDNFSLYIPSGSEYNYREIRSVYIDLLKRFKDLGYSESYEACDREFKAFVFLNDPDKLFGTVQNFLSKYWWGYGYDLWKIVLNTILLLVIISAINYQIFDKLNNEIYHVPSIYNLYRSTQENTLSVLNKYFLVLQYTGMIFFGMNLKIGDWNYHKKGLVLWMQAQFGLGLLCLAFVVNYFFK